MRILFICLSIGRVKTVLCMELEIANCFPLDLHRSIVLAYTFIDSLLSLSLKAVLTLPFSNLESCYNVKFTSFLPLTWFTVNISQTIHYITLVERYTSRIMWLALRLDL